MAGVRLCQSPCAFATKILPLKAAREQWVVLLQDCKRPSHAINGLVGKVRDGLAVELRPVSEQPVVAGIIESLKPGEDEILRQIGADDTQLLPALYNVHHPGPDLPGKGGKWFAFESCERRVLRGSDRCEEPGLLE